MPHEAKTSPEMQSCIEECLTCFSKCTETLQHCLTLGGSHAEKDHITLLQLCADTCQLSARAMLLGSKLHGTTCATCALICDACADDCESMDGEFMQECATICRSCADSCREMSGDGSAVRAKKSA